MSDSKLTQGSAIKVENIDALAEPFLTERTLKALQVKHNSLYHFDENREVTHQCLYIGKKVKISKITDGVKYVAEKINTFGEAGKIKSSLGDFIRFDLVPINVSEPETIVLCYIHVDLETYEAAMNDRSSGAFKEGQVPE